MLGLLLPAPAASDNKYSRGTVGFVTGSVQYPGAALLGVSGAQATGVGFVRYVGPNRVQDLLLLAHPEVVTAETFAASGPAQAWVLGSGMARGDAQLLQVREVLALATVAVIDAGALALIGAEESAEYALAPGAHHILTPHQGEICGLLNRLGAPSPRGGIWHPELLDTPELAWAAATTAAELTGHTVLLKGSITRVAAPNGERVEVGPNSPSLATAGTGDVLAGILGGIAAQNPAVAQNNWLDIARLAIELHSAAAQRAGEIGAVTASAVASAVSLEIRQRFRQ